MTYSLIERRDTVALADDVLAKGPLISTEAADSLSISGANLIVGGALLANSRADTCDAEGTAPGVFTDADFASRASAAGVFRVFHFNDVTQLGTQDMPVGAGWGWGAAPADGAKPRLDTLVKKSGKSSLRFDIVSPSVGNFGLWGCRFADDDSIQFGENSSIYVQVAMRLSSAVVNTAYERQAGAGGGYINGFKFFDIGTGRCTSSDPAVQSAFWARYGNFDPATSSDTKIVVTTPQGGNGTYKFPMIYNGETGSDWAGVNAGLYDRTGGDYLYENGVPNCNYTNSRSGCFWMPADQWVHFQLGVDIGARRTTGNKNAWDARVRLWGTYEGQATQLLIDWTGTTPGYFPMACGAPEQDQKIGKLWLLPYFYQLNDAQVFDAGTMHYDELIISTQQIPHPATYPTWRQNKTKDTWYEIPNTSKMPGATNVDSYTMDVWQGLAAAPTGFYSILASGDGKWRNAAHYLDLSLATPTWTTLNQGSLPDPGGLYSHTNPAPNGSPVIIDRPYYLDNRPIGRHTYRSTHYVPAGKLPDGYARVMALTCYAGYGVNQVATDGTPGFNSGSQVDAFNLHTNDYDQAWYWPSCSVPYTAFMTFAQHPDTYDVWGCGGNGDLPLAIKRWRSDQGIWETLVTTPAYPDEGRLRPWLSTNDSNACVVDSKRNRLTALIGGVGVQPAAVTLQSVDLTTGAVTNLALTGTYPAAPLMGARSLIWDQDNDRYLYANNTSTDPGAVTNIYSINPNTGASVLLNTVNTHPATDGIYSRFSYFKQLGCVVYVSAYNENIWFMPVK